MQHSEHSESLKSRSLFTFKQSVEEVLFFIAVTQQSDHFMQQLSVAVYNYQFFKEDFYYKLITSWELLDDFSCYYYCREGHLQYVRFVISMKVLRNQLLIYVLHFRYIKCYLHVIFMCLDHLGIKFRNYSQSSKDFFYQLYLHTNIKHTLKFLYIITLPLRSFSPSPLHCLTFTWPSVFIAN
jgi:hypothetical protein